MSTKPSFPTLTKFSASYTALADHFENRNIAPLDSNLDEVNKKLLAAVSNEITGITSEIQTTAVDGFESLKQVAADVKALPDAIAKDIEAMPKMFGIQRFNNLASRVKLLLNSFQEVLQNPSVIFPRLACGDLPVDPVLIFNFRKRYLKVERLNRDDSQLKQEERSLPTAPKSALDVITNVTSSLESFGDDVLASTEALANLSGELDKLRELVRGLIPAAAPVLEMFEKQEAIHDIISRVASLFKIEEESPSHPKRTLNKHQRPNPINLVKEASSMVEKMKVTSDELNSTVTKIHGASTLLSSFITDLKDFLSIAVQRLSRLAEAFQKFRANLPRIGRELRHFFMPTGLKALIFRPSGTLVSILASVEDIKTSLSEPEAAARSAIDTVKESDSAGKVETVKKSCDELQNIPTKLVSTIEKQDIQQIIADTLERVVSELLNEIGADAVQGTATSILAAVGAGDVAGQVHQNLSFLPEHIDNKLENSSKHGPWGDGEVCLPWGAEKLFR